MKAEFTSFFNNTHIQKKLNELERRAKATSLSARFAADKNRFDNFSIDLDGLLFDFSKNHIDDDTLSTLIAGASDAGLTSLINDMFEGKKINNTEGRAVLHTALRSPPDNRPPHLNATIAKAQQNMNTFSDAIRNKTWLGATGKPLTQIINIGIGGSDLGPAMAVDALSHYAHKDFEFHFVSNIDPTHIAEALAKCTPETTLLIVSSKSFSTLETLSNAKAAKNWLISALGSDADIGKHFIGISSNVDAVTEFGIPENNILPMWDWV